MILFNLVDFLSGGLISFRGGWVGLVIREVLLRVLIFLFFLVCYMNIIIFSVCIVKRWRSIVF